MNEAGKPVDPSDEAPTLDARSTGTPTSSSQPVHEIGGFRILGKLGEGGMGIVYEAEQQSPRRRVALKVIRGGRHVDEVSLRMFRRETETLGRLAHPNIAAIYEAGRTEDGQHFFTMELVTGRRLSEYSQERLGGERPTTDQLRERLRLFATLCRAVNYAHQRGVIHRDLKPSNIVVTEAGDVKVLDFGLARITDTDAAAASLVSDVGAIKGTLPYMSPEQARGDTRDIDLRTDVYSLGVILYELLSGRQPYETSSITIVQAIRIICEEPPRVLKATPGGVVIAADLQTVVAKALAKSPDGRYQSAGALADDIERYLADQPILAHPPSTAYQLRKYVARHKGRMTALAAIGLLVVALMVTLVVQGRRVRVERDLAKAEAAKSEAINRFLIDALGQADPWQRGSRSVTLVDALHQAQPLAHSAFRNQPLIEASVLQTLGTTFAGLADFAEADTALRASLALREHAAGPRSSEAAQSLDALAAMYIQWERFPDAEKYAREALDISRTTEGATSLLTAAAMSNLATALGKEARLPEAKALAQQSIQIASSVRARGPDAQVAEFDPDAIETGALSVLGEVALDQGDGKEHERVAREWLAITTRRDSGSTADHADALNSLGTALLTNGDLKGAERALAEAVDRARAALGDDHPTLALYRENLGNVYFREGRLDLTARNLELVLAMRRKALGDDSEPVARTLANMATVYLRAGKLAEAEMTYPEAIERLGRKLGAEHPDVGITRLGFGLALTEDRKFAQAESELQHALAILTKAYGEGNALTQRTLSALVDLYGAWKKPAQAAAYRARLIPAK